VSGGWTPPTIGDLVWCLFPELPGIEPGPKPRPGLVVRVETRDDGVIASVVYGTSKRVTHLKAGEFAILRALHPVAFDLAGLAFDTKFDFKVTLDLPWLDRYFRVPPNSKYGQCPKLGSLHVSLLHAAKAAHDAAMNR